MACDPVESVLVVQTADVTPLLVESVGVHSTLVPSVNVNVPPGGVTAAEPGARTFTIAVNVTACPETAGLAEEVTAVGEDLYNDHSTQRDVFILAADLTYGDSGAPVVTTSGKVVGIAFAIAPDRPTTAYALSTSELLPLLSDPHSREVSTQGCVDG